MQYRTNTHFLPFITSIVLTWALMLSAADLCVAGRPQQGSAISRLNLRSGPGTTHGIVGVVKTGETVTVLQSTSDTETVNGQTDRWMQVRRDNGTTGWIFGAFLKTGDKKNAPSPIPSADMIQTQSKQASTLPSSPSSKIMPLNKEILPRLLKENGFEAPLTFKAIIIEIVPSGDGGYVYYPMDYNGTSKDRDNWWPASTVKLYAAVAALEQLRVMGFNPNKTEVTYNYDDGPLTQPFEETLRRAITDSKNPEFDRLVDIVGSERLNRKFLTDKNGIHDTVMLRCYSGRTPNPDTGKCSNRVSPELILKSDKKEKTLPLRTNTGEFLCDREGNCTTLADLTEVTRRIMMHDSLPDTERFRLGKRELALLRDAMKGKYARGGVADGIRFAFKNRKVEIFHKAGYADQWFSDNMFIKVQDTNEQWIIGMADRPDRAALDEVARIVATLIADHTISKERVKEYDEAVVDPGPN